MSKVKLIAILAAMAAMAAWRHEAPPAPVTLDGACVRANTEFGGLTVRVPWTAAGPRREAAEVHYCVLRGAADATLAFERNAEVVHFAVIAHTPDPAARKFTFSVHTTAGRTMTQGPSVVTPGSGFRRGCRAEMCQFITDPGEFVASVDVQME